MEDLRCYDTYMDRVNTLLNEYAGEWLDTSMLGDANAHFAAGLTPHQCACELIETFDLRP